MIEIIFAQLLAICHNMIDCDFNLNLNKKIMIEYIDKYNLSETYKQLIMDMIENKAKVLTETKDESKDKIKDEKKEETKGETKGKAKEKAKEETKEEAKEEAKKVAKKDTKGEIKKEDRK